MEGRYPCGDCDQVFKSKKLRATHAFHEVHMRDSTCIGCYKVFDTPHSLSLHKTLHKSHQSEAVAKIPGSGPDAEVIRQFGEMELNASQLGHSSTARWRGSEGAALKQRPDHAYPWVSPAQTGGIYAQLHSEVLDRSRRASEGFPFPGQIKPKSRDFSVSNLPQSPPEPSAGRAWGYAALVLDCEMIALEDQVQDLISLSVVDFLSGAVVLNALVQPTGRVKDWRSRVTGVNPAVLRAAKEDPRQTVLRGWPEARERIFAVADAHTVFIGHALPNDLAILRIATDRAVDSVVLTAQAAFGRAAPRFPRKWGLKSACAELLGVEVQKKRAAHDPLEDALATRELVIWCLANPARLLEWGAAARAKYEKEAEERRERQRIEALKKAEEKRRLEEEAEGGMEVALAI
ncbi:ribonuclease H-like domain-containing protein [Xylaria grammica]|nr:ribonuclease H-like domain-containing protein [Xylaria grammica]